MGCGERVRAGRAGSESEGDYGAGERRERESAGCGQPKCRDDAWGIIICILGAKTALCRFEMAIFMQLHLGCSNSKDAFSIAGFAWLRTHSGLLDL